MRDINVINPHDPISKLDIKDFEKEKDIELPEDYKSFLLKYNGGIIEKPYRFTSIESVWKNIEEKYNESIQFLGYLGDDGVNNLRSLYHSFKEEQKMMPEEVIPIIEAFNNYICISVKGENYGKVYYWNHNFAPDYGDEPTWDCMILVANNFTDFINSLYAEEDD